MIVIGIVGGIASGKSFVTSQLESFGAVVLDADRIGHQVLLQESVKSAIQEQWGEAVFSSDGEVDRGSLAAIVFDPDHPEQLSRLERITHPRIAEKIRTDIACLDKSGNIHHLVLDAPVMVKAGWHVFCDVIIFVDATRDLRWQRASRRGWTREMFETRESMQASVGKKRMIGTHVIDNNGTREQTHQQVNEFWKKITTPTLPGSST